MSRRRSSSVTIRDVARKAGVSVATVSRYINRNAPVSQEVAERLDEVMIEMRYVPHAAARHLASRKTRVIGLLLNNLHNDFFVPLLNGVEGVIRKKGYNLIVATYHADIRNETPPPIGPHNTDGLLVFSDGLVDDDLINLNARGFPMVLVHRTPPPSVSIPSVTVENTEITHKLVDHLIKVHGKRRIMFLRGPIHQEDSLRREVGYKSALRANGIPFDENLILNGEFDRDIAYQVMHGFLNNGRQIAFDAVFTGDDDSAIGVLRALHQHDYRVPEEIAVVGFDDLGFASFLSPPLTTVRAPTEAVGRIATERLFGLLENQLSDEVMILPTEIIFRRSCGCQS
ncbi:MAG: LacI family transcriptional regulator [Anaerolineae bacterium]|nr:LacI family transcriptional regulator [Anaerolineae bacterium]MCI0610997.1 LacI family transcriptional regulator [Anaerolineae bacterium]